MSDAAKETVIIVHGTWSAPECATLKPEGAAPLQPPQRKWYEPVDGRPGGEPFPAKLDAALRERGCSARCWAHCAKDNQSFQWSGRNSWIDRTRAASALGGYVAKLQAEGWRCHIVAHSHGGNVVVEALPHIMTSLDSKKPQGELVTLGTPFMDTMSPILEMTRRRFRLLNIVSWIGFSLLMALALLLFLVGKDQASLVTSYFLFGLAAIFLLGVLFGRKRQRTARRSIDNASQTQPQFLAIGSLADEAWQILHHLRWADNPTAVKSSLFVYLFSSLSSTILQGTTVARIHGARSHRDLGSLAKQALVFIYGLGFLVAAIVLKLLSEQASRGYITSFFVSFLFFLLILVFTAIFGETFFSAFWSPFRWCARRVGSLASVFPAMVTYGVRSSGWSVLLKMIMGLESYRFEIPLVEQYPSGVGRIRQI